MLQTDSAEYEILQEATEAVRFLDQNALSCEIGLRAGGGSKVIIDALIATDQTARTHIAIDPYGNIEYLTSEDNKTRHDYTNHMRNQCMWDLYQYICEQRADQINILVFLMEDSEFFKRFGDGVPVYEEYKRIATEYALVHFDGPHALEPLREEVSFFTSRLADGAHVVFDDIGNYPHNQLEKELLGVGFTLVKKGDRKASYKYHKS